MQFRYSIELLPNAHDKVSWYILTTISPKPCGVVERKMEILGLVTTSLIQISGLEDGNLCLIMYFLPILLDILSPYSLLTFIRPSNGLLYLVMVFETS